MPRALPSFVIAAVFALAAPAAGQYQRFPPETVEPPLADAATPIQPVAGTEPRALPTAVRALDTPAAVVQLRVLAPTVAPAAREMELKLVVENFSRVAAKEVAVVYLPPAGAEVTKSEPPPSAKQANAVTWRLDTLAAAGRKEIAVTLKLPPDATEIEHNARVYHAQDQTVRTRIAKPGLVVRKTGPELAQQHDILVFGVEVTNSGGVDLTDVQVTDELPAGLEHRLDADKPPSFGEPTAVVNEPRRRTWNVGRIAAGQTRRFDYHVHARQIGTVEHTAVATAAGKSVQVTAPPVRVKITELQLEMKVTAPPRESANRAAKLQVTLRNLSLRPLDNIAVTDVVLDSCKLEAISGGGQLFDKQVQWIVPTLRQNETLTLEVSVRNAGGGPVRHQVRAVYRGLTKTGEAATEFDATASLKWDLRGSTPTTEVNGEVTYTLTIRNAGSGPATHVRPTVTLPSELAFLKAQPLMHKADGQKVAFDPVTLPAGGEAVYQVSARAIRATVAARVEAELAADVLTAGAVRRQEVTAIGGSGPHP
jgi:uncharacterized repeat protein (TIGR01451 family)